MTLFKNKKFLIFLICLLLFDLVFFLWFFAAQTKKSIWPEKDLLFGLTYSQKQAETLGLDWQKVYLAVLDDLGARRLRLAAYWDEIEKAEGQYDWQRLDWLIDQAGQREAEIILAVGGRLPRWPECHWPSWAADVSEAEREKKILAYLEASIRRYQDRKNILAWQVENEPFLSSYFGECPPLRVEFLDQEIALVKRLDARPVVVTDSGELSFWLSAARRADIFGTTMYRDTYSSHFKRYIHYPLTPAFFRLKKLFVSWLAKPSEWIVIELQAEPWASAAYQQVSAAERARTMDMEKFRSTLEFARQTGFQKFYLWGAEYWYWERTVNGNDDFWNYAKNLFDTKNF